MFKEINESLFRRWQGGDEKAGIAIRNILMIKYLQVATQIMRRAGILDYKALEAFEKALSEMENKKGNLRWKGPEAFNTFFRRRLQWRCGDIIRKELSKRKGIIIETFSALFPDEEEGRRIIEQLIVINPDEKEKEEERRGILRKLIEDFENTLTGVLRETWDAIKEAVEDNPNKGIAERVMRRLEINRNTFDLRIHRIKKKFSEFCRERMIRGDRR